MIVCSSGSQQGRVGLGVQVRAPDSRCWMVSYSRFESQRNRKAHGQADRVHVSPVVSQASIHWPRRAALAETRGVWLLRVQREPA